MTELRVVLLKSSKHVALFDFEVMVDEGGREVARIELHGQDPLLAHAPHQKVATVSDFKRGDVPIHLADIFGIFRGNRSQLGLRHQAK